MKYFIVLLYFSFISMTIPDSINEDNWLQDSEIKEIRELYAEITKSIESKTFHQYQRLVEQMGEYQLSKEMHVDSTGGIRMSQTTQQDETGRFKINAYYNAQGKLRFIYAVSETMQLDDSDRPSKNEYRIYYKVNSESFNYPFWSVKSELGEYTEFGQEVDIKNIIGSLNLRDPYAEFHDQD